MIGRRSPIAILTERQRVRLVRPLNPTSIPSPSPPCATGSRSPKMPSPPSNPPAASMNSSSSRSIPTIPTPPPSAASKSGAASTANRRHCSPSAPSRHFYDHPLYIEALVTNIGKCLRQFPDASPHPSPLQRPRHPAEPRRKGRSLPQAHQGNRSPRPCEQGAARFPNWPKTHVLCFQSHVGPAKWLEPSFLATLEKLGHEGVKEALVVPISFVTEHIETLHEINIEGRADAKKSGIARFRMMPAVGDSPAFIGALKDLVLRAVEIHPDPKSSTSTAA